MEDETIHEKMLPRFNGLKIYCGRETDCAMCANVLENKNVLRYKNLWLAPDFSQVAEGYLIVFSNRCVPSIGYFSSKEFQEITELTEKTKKLLKKKYASEVIFFEHGAVNTIAKKAGCCVAHAHLHAIPVEDDIALDAITKELKMYVKKLKKIEIKDVSELKKIIDKKISYLLYISTKGKMTVFCIGKNRIPSQLFRKHVAKLPKIYEKNKEWLAINKIKGLNDLTWNWRHFRPADRYNQTAAYLLGEFKEGLNEVSAR